MFEYEIRYIDKNLQNKMVKLEAVGIAEVIDVFIETYCPVHTIESVVKSMEMDYPVSRERMPA